MVIKVVTVSKILELLLLNIGVSPNNIKTTTQKTIIEISAYG